MYFEGLQRVRCLRIVLYWYPRKQKDKRNYHLSDQDISHPLVPKGGSMGPHLNFPAEFVMNATLYIHTLKITIFKQKKVQKLIYRFKMAAKLAIFILGDYEYVYITNIKFGNLEIFTPMGF